MDDGAGIAVPPDEAGWFGECEQGTVGWIWFVETAVPGVYGERGVFPDGVIIVHGGGRVQASGTAGKLEAVYNQDAAV